MRRTEYNALNALKRLHEAGFRTLWISTEALTAASVQRLHAQSILWSHWMWVSLWFLGRFCRKAVTLSGVWWPANSLTFVVLVKKEPWVVLQSDAEAVQTCGGWWCETRESCDMFGARGGRNKIKMWGELPRIHTYSKSICAHTVITNQKRMTVFFNTSAGTHMEGAKYTVSSPEPKSRHLYKHKTWTGGWSCTVLRDNYIN